MTETNFNRQSSESKDELVRSLPSREGDGTQFKHTDIGLIPHDWETVKLGDVLTICNGKDYKHLPKGEVPVYGTGGQIASVDGYLYDGETICIGRKGTIDKPQYHTGKIWTIDTLFYTRVFGALPIFLFYKSTKVDWQSINEATGVPSLTSKNISNVQISLPPTIAEQKRIAEALQNIDSLIEALDEQIAKKQAIKTGAMQQLLTAKTRLKGFNGEWKTVKLGDVAEIVTGKKDVNIAVENGLYNFYTCSKEIYKTNVYSFDTEAILIAGNGDVGNLHYYKGKFEAYQRTYVISNFTNIDIQFVLQNLEWNLIKHLKEGVIGSTIPYIVIGQLQNYPICYPTDLAEQRAIAEVLSNMDAEIQALQDERNKYALIKQGMMQDLLTGKIRI